MGKKIRVVRRTPDPDRTPKTYESCVLESGQTVSVGDSLLVLHRSTSGRWQESLLKRISNQGSEEEPEWVFYFYISPPGTISVLEKQIRVPKKKKIRINRNQGE